MQYKKNILARVIKKVASIENEIYLAVYPSTLTDSVCRTIARDVKTAICTSETASEDEIFNTIKEYMKYDSYMPQKQLVIKLGCMYILKLIYVDELIQPYEKDNVVNAGAYLAFDGNLQSEIYKNAIKEYWPCLPEDSEQYKFCLIAEREKARTSFMNYIHQYTGCGAYPCILLENGHCTDEIKDVDDLYTTLCKLSIHYPNDDIVITKQGTIKYGKTFELIAVNQDLRDDLSNHKKNNPDVDYPLKNEDIKRIVINHFFL